MPFDLDALAREAEGEPFVFTFGGEDYQMAAHPDIRAVAALSAGRLDDALRMLLGVDQWDRLQRVDALFDTETLSALLDAYGAHAGVEVPNSSAPTSFSKSTVARSKPTSNGRITPRSRTSTRAV